MSERPSAGEYEQLVELLVHELLPSSGVVTDRIERDVRVQGRSTSNQIDVLWDLTDAAGLSKRIVFEARSYARRVDQGRLHAFRSVVDDIQDEQRPVTGVMVTTTGYQRGAQAVASTYGLVVLELREPTPQDRAGRVTSIQVEVRMHMPVIRDVSFEAVATSDEAAPHEEGYRVTGDGAIIETPSGRTALVDLLLDGELGVLGHPKPLHSIRRILEQPAALIIDGAKVATVSAVTAVVGDASAPAATFTVGGLQDVAWMIRDALSGARAWIAEDGRVWRTDS